MEDIDDDFGELYADFDVQASSAINGVPSNKILDESHLIKNDDNKSEAVNDGDKEAGVENGSDSDSDDDDDFDVVVNDDDFGAKNGGVDGRGCREAREDEEDEFVPRITEGNSTGKDQMWVETKGMEHSGSGYGGERVNLGKNSCNSQYNYVRRYGSTGNQRSISSRRDNKEDTGYIQHRKPSLGRYGPSYAGHVPGLAEHGNGFWLPWYRTILDVDIDTFEQKPWTCPGADVTDYFNFGFDEENWKCYCQSLGQLRQQTLAQNRNQFNESLRTKVENEGANLDEREESIPDGHGRIDSQESDFYRRQFKRQIGRAIHVEDSNTERQPSMDARAPRNRDPDVVIEITVQDPEGSSSSVKEDPDDILETKRTISVNGRGCQNVELETEKPAGSKHCQMARNCTEENIRSPSASSNLKRSYQSTTVSSHMLQDSSSQGKAHNSESDAPHSGKVNTFSRENARAVDTLNTSKKDADTNSSETNPCVADIDLLFDDHIQSSPTTFDSDSRSKASNDGDNCDIRTKDCLGSSSDSVTEEHQVVEDGYHVSRKSQRNVPKIKSRVRSPIEEDRKHFQRRVRRHSELNSYSDEDENYHIGIGGRTCGRNQLRGHHHRSKERVHTSFDDEDWPRYREKESSFGCHDNRYFEKRIKAACMRESHLHDHWRSRDETGLHLPREWDEEEFFPERRIRQTKGEIVGREWYLHERECMIRDEKPLYQNQSHIVSKYLSSVDIERWNQRRDYDDIHFSKRSKHDMSLEYRYSDGSAIDSYARSYPLNGGKEYLDSDIKRERRLRHIGKEVAISGRVDQYPENPSLDLDYPWYNRGDDEYSHWQTSPSIHDYHDRHPAYAERRHDFTVERDDVDDPRLFQKYGRHGRYISAQKGSYSRPQFYDHKDAYDRQDTVRYHEDDYFREKQSVIQSKGMNWIEDALSFGCFDNDIYDEGKLDSFEGVSRHKSHGTKHGFVPGRMSLHGQNMNHKRGILRGGGGKSSDTSSMLPTRAEHKQTRLWCRNSVEVHHVVRERKSTGKCSKPGSDPEKDVHAATDGKVMEFKVPKVETLQKDSFPVRNQDDASDLEEGQIPIEEPGSEIITEKKYGHKAQKLTSQNDSLVYDENRILETRAKMEKRRERFKEPVLMKETDSDPKPHNDPFVERDESKQQRPARKRRWGGM